VASDQVGPKVKIKNKSHSSKVWAEHNIQWREPEQIASQWSEAGNVDFKLMRYKTSGDFWQIISHSKITLLVTREYEHLLMALSFDNDKPLITYFPLPHPSGLAVDHKKKLIYLASTRNPNQIFTFVSVQSIIPRLDVEPVSLENNPLIPVRTNFYPGCLYLHDLNLLEGALHANAVGQNTVVRINEDGCYQRVWWPKCIETESGPVFGQNHLQLNSIAAGRNLEESYFSASTDKISRRRPGHKNFPVDKKGVIFSGRTREPIAFGLTRPHSARIYDGKIWVDNSGYGEFGFIEEEKFFSLARLPGWTRGLCFRENIAFIGVSRVLPRFCQYAPGLNVEQSVCGVYAVETGSGKILGSMTWDYGNQIFAVEWISQETSRGLPFLYGIKKSPKKDRLLFYTFHTNYTGAK
jgi:uncharacterized protein (TIGR03032 family)